jgi:hypothetical protein
MIRTLTDAGYVTDPIVAARARKSRDVENGPVCWACSNRVFRGEQPYYDVRHMQGAAGLPVFCPVCTRSLLAPLHLDLAEPFGVAIQPPEIAPHLPARGWL